MATPNTIHHARTESVPDHALTSLGGLTDAEFLDFLQPNSQASAATTRSDSTTTSSHLRPDEDEEMHEGFINDAPSQLFNFDSQASSVFPDLAHEVLALGPPASPPAPRPRFEGAYTDRESDEDYVPTTSSNTQATTTDGTLTPDGEHPTSTKGSPSPLTAPPLPAPATATGQHPPPNTPYHAEAQETTGEGTPVVVPSAPNDTNPTVPPTHDAPTSTTPPLRTPSYNAETAADRSDSSIEEIDPPSANPNEHNVIYKSIQRNSAPGHPTTNGDAIFRAAYAELPLPPSTLRYTMPRWWSGRNNTHHMWAIRALDAAVARALSVHSLVGSFTLDVARSGKVVRNRKVDVRFSTPDAQMAIRGIHLKLPSFGSNPAATLPLPDAGLPIGNRYLPALLSGESCCPQELLHHTILAFRGKGVYIIEAWARYHATDPERPQFLHQMVFLLYVPSPDPLGHLRPPSQAELARIPGFVTPLSGTGWFLSFPGRPSWCWGCKGRAESYHPTLECDNPAAPCGLCQKPGHRPRACPRQRAIHSDSDQRYFPSGDRIILPEAPAAPPLAFVHLSVPHSPTLAPADPSTSPNRTITTTPTTPNRQRGSSEGSNTRTPPTAALTFTLPSRAGYPLPAPGSHPPLITERKRKEAPERTRPSSIANKLKAKSLTSRKTPSPSKRTPITPSRLSAVQTVLRIEHTHATSPVPTTSTPHPESDHASA